MSHTLRTVLAIEVRHTGTIVVIFFDSTSCIVFARFGITVVDSCKIQIKLNEQLNVAIPKQTAEIQIEDYPSTQVTVLFTQV